MIEIDNYDKYIQQYPNFEYARNDIILHETSTHYFLPRLFYKNYPSKYLKSYRDEQWKAQYHNDVEFLKPLKQEQQVVANNVLNLLNTSAEVGIVHAIPGFGKTVVGIYLAVISKKKTLILLDNDNLRKQWKETILNFTNIPEENIGIIQANTFTANENTPIIIAMVQTLISRVKNDLKAFYERIRPLGIDLVLADECHQTTAGPQYNKASLLINTKNIVGLSATPFASFIHKILMENMIGQDISVSNTYDKTPKINFVKFDSGLSKKYGKRVKFCRDLVRQRAVYNKAIIESQRYFELILSLVQEGLKNGHKILIIVFTTEQLRQISNMLTSNGITNRQFYSKEKEIDKELDEVLVGTYKFIGQGFDMKSLSMLINASPLSGKKSLIQIIGRILRESSGKKDPVVHDIIDTGFDGIFTQEIVKKIAIFRKEFVGCEIYSVNNESGETHKYD